MRQVVLDTETTGLEVLNGHRIIEIGAVEVVNRRLTGRTFHKYINPDRAIDDGAKEVHGITEAFLADKPRFADVWPELDTFLRGAELVIHNAPFDIAFLCGCGLRYHGLLSPSAAKASGTEKQSGCLMPTLHGGQLPA